MNQPQHQAPLRFFRGRRLYQIAAAYDGTEGYIGICDGRVIARGQERAEVARAMIRALGAH